MSEFTKWRDWEVRSFIGEGSFGKVYRIEREAFGHVYSSALKVIRIPADEKEYDSVIGSGMSEEDAKAYFRDMVETISEEFALMSELKGNSNIVSFEDYEIVPLEDGYSWNVFIRMELLEPFTKVMREKNFNVEEVLKLGIDICKALELCETKNIIHRDIKPENVFLSPQGTYKLGDFGIARELEGATAGMSKKGTASFMAPEVYRGMAYGPSVDIYSLGVMLYRLMNNNRNPFMPAYPAKIKYTDVELSNQERFSGKTMPLPANAQDDLGKIILKACAFNPEDRYARASLMRRDLELYRATGHIDPEDEITERESGYSPSKERPEGQILYDDRSGSLYDDRTVGPPIYDGKTVGPAVSAEKTVGPAAYAEKTVDPASYAGKAVGTAAGEGGEAESLSEDANDRTDIPAGKKGRKNKKKGGADGESGKSPGGKSPGGRKKPGKGIIAAIVAVIVIGIAAAIGIHSSGTIVINGYEYRKDATYVHLNEEDVTPENISMLSRFPELNWIIITDAELTDECIKALGDVQTAATRLEIKNCTGIKDLSPITNLKYLGYINLSNTGLNDEALAGVDFGSFEHLRALVLNGNEDLTSLEPVRGAVPTIQGLAFDKTGISDISVLEGAKELRALTAAYTGISDMSPLADSRKMLFLNLSGNNIEDYTVVAGMPDINELRLDANKITTVVPASKCSNLMTLFLSGNQIDDLSPLEGHSSLVELYVSDNKLTSLHGLEHELELTYLGAGDNDIEDLSGIANCTQLKEVYLDNNTKIDDLSILTKSKDLLHQVSINNLPVGNLDVFKGMNLTMLYCDNTGIDSLEPIAGASELEVLSAKDNSIESLEPLKGKNALRAVFLGGNKISDMSPVTEGCTDDLRDAHFELSDNKIKTLIIPRVYSYNGMVTVFGNPVDSVEYPPTAETDYYLDVLGLDYYENITELGALKNGSCGIYIEGAPLDKQVAIKDALKVTNVAYDDENNTMFSGRTKPMEMMAQAKAADRDLCLVIHRSTSYRNEVIEDPEFTQVDYD